MTAQTSPAPQAAQTPAPVPPGRTACVIGAGFGGVAAKFSDGDLIDRIGAGADPVLALTAPVLKPSGF